MIKITDIFDNLFAQPVLPKAPKKVLYETIDSPSSEELIKVADPSPQLELEFLKRYDEDVPLLKEVNSNIKPQKKELTLDSFVDGLKYGKVKEETAYWEGLKVKSDLDYFKRWVFAFASIHTTFKNNVEGYKMLINDMSWTISKERLLEMLEGSSLGLTSMRYKALWDFARKFRANPKQFYKKRNETWVELRDRLASSLYGIGQAKVSFALNLSWPVEAKVCCLDVHLLRFLGWDKKAVPPLKKYKAMEQKWLDKCDEYGIGYNIAREMYWNKIQGKRNSRYWSYCLEK